MLQEEKCNEFIEKLEDFKKYGKYKMEIIKNVRHAFEKNRFRSKWEEGDIQNQEFLMLVNKYSGRSFNDLR